MADVVLDLESSRQSSRVVEFYDVALSTGVVYHLASGNRDLLFGGILYEAIALERTEIKPTQIQANEGDDLSLTLPIDHAIVRRCLAMASPPQQITITCWRKQENATTAEQQWIGIADGLQCSEDGSTAKLIIPSRTACAARRVMPTIQASTSCQHVLYGPACRQSRAAFTVATTAILVDGRTVRVDMGSLARGGDWAENGELVHGPTGERMSIAQQHDANPGISTVADLVIERPIVELKTGDAITVYAGCKKGISVCNLKFSNRDNYGGFPDMPTKNPSVPTMLGVEP